MTETETTHDNHEIWRWNSDPAWHYHCSMACEAAKANEANNDFMRYHHLRSCFYFGVSALEAFLNGMMRRALEKKGTSESKIHKQLRYSRLDTKRNEWPSEICGKPVKFDTEIESIFSLHKALRDEITHPKRRDHSIYSDLDNAQPESLVDAISLAMVSIFEGMSEPFPYWVLGWNYVGMNNNAAYPCQLNNLNGFFWSLKYMGFNVGMDAIGWDKRNMISRNDFKNLKAALSNYPGKIESFLPQFPTRPRLTCRWWDHGFIYETMESEIRG